MTPIEIFAGIIAVVTLVKILVIIKNPEKWIDIAEAIWKNPGPLLVVSLVLATIVLYQLLQEITIVQIFAVMLFLMLVMVTSMAIYSKEVLQLGRKILKERNMLRRGWLPILIWTLLSIWVLKEVI